MEWLKSIFFIDDAVKGINKPTDSSHFRTLRFHLNVLNCWPGKELGENVSKYRIILTFVYIVVCSLIFIGSSLYVSSRKLTFYELGHTYITQMMCVVTISRIFLVALSKKCKYVFSTFIKKIHLLYYKEKSEYAMKAYRQVHRMSHLFTIMLITQGFLGLTFFTFIPVYRNYSRGLFKVKVLSNATYEHPIYYAFPLDIHSSLHTYIFTIPLNYFLCYFSTSWFIMVDLLLSTMIFHLWGHLKILMYDLDSFPLPNRQVVLRINNEDYAMNDMYSEEESVQVARKLKECIIYHRMIIKFADKVTESFGPVLFIYYTFHQACGCLLLLLCSQMTLDALVTYGLLTTVAYQLLIQMSVIFEMIGSTSEKLKDSVYCLPWQYMDTPNRRTVLIFLIRVQEPIHVKALGLAQIGVTSMASIIKTSLSYFMFLRTI